MLLLSRYATAVDVDGTVAVHSGRGGDLALVPAGDWRRVEAFCSEQDDGRGIEDLLERLVRQRILVSDSTDELDLLRRRYARGRHGGTLGFTVVTSLGCNFACSYCFEAKRPSLLRPQVADAIVRVVDDTPDPLGALHVTWMGGEPLLGLDQLLDLSDRLIQRADGRGAPYGAALITNGWHLDGATAEQLALRRVRRAQVTIDGPASVHDRYRPHLSGGPTFERIVQNIVAAADHLSIGIRVNLDRGNLGTVDQLLEELADRGLSGKVSVGAARMTDVVANEEAPIASYSGSCLSGQQYAALEVAFHELLRRHGFSAPALPAPVGTPCTAVRATEVVVGAEGELWKCWDDIGNADEVIGTIFDCTLTNDRVAPWLSYDPFSDPDCSTCVALPGCMGGCAHHLFHGSRDERCGSFRHNHRQRVEAAARRRLGLAVQADVGVFRSAGSPGADGGPVPVVLLPRRGRRSGGGADADRRAPTAV